MRRYRLSSDAERDLIEIARYIAKKANLETAETVLTEIIEKIILLADHPDLGRAEAIYGTGVRSLTSKQYKIYYRKQRTRVLVLHVFHAARDQGKAWRDQ